MKDIKVIGFDADDTLWHNEQYFLDAEKQFWELLEDFLPQHASARELMKTEMQNIQLYGYGIKAFTLSMIETAISITDGTITSSGIEKIIGYGKDMLAKPIEIIPDVEHVLTELQGKYRLVVVTKGDLLDQQRKLIKSDLEGYFHHIEIVSEKNNTEYLKLTNHLDITPSEFVMIGNSLKSDVLPVLNIGGHGMHVPYHTTWEHEQINRKIEHEQFYELETIKDVLNYF
ncbi:MAG: HAD hydrolase-like protein [Pseudomonadales bacterium]|nr:HAD hydrolase-like protein [Pseudomonadales bacterium]